MKQRGGSDVVKVSGDIKFLTRIVGFWLAFWKEKFEFKDKLKIKRSLYNE